MAQSQDSKSLLDLSALNNLETATVGIVYTEWNDAIVAEQLAGCKRILKQFNTNITGISVPGCFEIPFMCKHMWNTYANTDQRPDVIIAFGAVIRGGTPHFDYVCKAVTEGVTQLNLQLPIPVIFGVLTLDNEQQAWERLGGQHGHKGEEAAITALKMVASMRNTAF